MPAIPEIPYADAKALTRECVHPARSSMQADLFALDWHGRPALLKDFSARPWWIRCSIARIVMGREFRALRRLQGVEGIPVLLGRAGPLAIVMERLDADRLPRDKETPPSPQFFERAGALLGELHRRGIGHGDLRRKNILIDDAERPYLIDFATSVTSRPGLGGVFTRFIYERMKVIDLAKFAGIKSEFYPDSLTAEERGALDEIPWYLSFGRFLKRNVYRMKKPHHRKAAIERFKASLAGKDEERRTKD